MNREEKKRLYIHVFIILLCLSQTVLAQSTAEKRKTIAETKDDVTRQTSKQNLLVTKNWQFETVPIWAEEFNYTGQPDTNNWKYDLGGKGWGNHELQNYTNDSGNVYVANGLLTITARKEISGNNQYTSTRLVTKNKHDFLYGRIEVKAQLPAGRGTWPAIWMLATDNVYGSWPKSGEFDIMEHVGFDQNKIHITAHTEKYNHRLKTEKSANKIVTGVSTGFHIYRVDWTPDAMKGYVDDSLLLTFKNDGTGYQAWPFDQRFHLLLNIAVGGDWGGQKGVDDSIFPASMLVDYIRVYKMIN